MWRGGLGEAYRLPTLSSVGASLARHASVSTSRSSNRTCGFPASGSRRKCHDVAHGKLLVRLLRQTRPSTSCRVAGGNRLLPGHSTLCLAHNH